MDPWPWDKKFFYWGFFELKNKVTLYLLIVTGQYWPIFIGCHWPWIRVS